MNTLLEVDTADVQGLIVEACPLQHSRHHVLRVIDAAGARTFLAALLKHKLVTTAGLSQGEAERRCPLNIGFTYRGLQSVGLHVKYLRVFQEKATAFAEGACIRAARRLADTGESAAQWWEKSFHHDRAHVLVSIHAEHKDELNAFTDTLRNMQGGDAFEGWKDRLDGEHLTKDPDYRKVHFGFRDLIAQPAIRGLHPEKKKMHEPGEFLLGYRNDHGFNPWLLIEPTALPERWPPLSAAERKFFLNGSFAALRKMEQNEADFRAQIKEWCETHEVGEEYIKAKIVGRWADGRLIRPGEMEPPKGQPPADLDDFDFTHDPEGLGCPFGSHVRRMNPREDRVVPTRKRTLIRRGMPYGGPFEKEPNEKRGLLGLFFCASLEDQFEHLLGEWGDANPMGPPNRGTAKDPFIGSRSDLEGVFDIPIPGEDLCQLGGFKPFVITRGTLYAFFPGMAALRAIASGKACS